MTTTDVTTFTDKEAFVWLGFRRDTSLDFRLTLPYDKEEAKRVIEAVDCYNRCGTRFRSGTYPLAPAR